MADKQPQTVVALASGYVGYKGQSVMILEESVWDRNDPIVKAYPKFFGLPAEPIIEQATAAPGEKRGA